MEIGQKKINSLMVFLIAIFFSTPQILAMEKTEQKEKSIINTIFEQDEFISQPGSAVIPVKTLEQTLSNCIKVLISCIKKQGDEVTPGETSYIEKLHLKQGNKNENKVIVIGDLHGKAHSAARIVHGLQTEFKFLRKDLTLQDPNAIIVCTGDLADRGYYGVETWYLFMQLLLKNRGRVFIIRGSHEEEGSARQYGFYKELHTKYKQEKGELLFKSFLKLFALLPSALYIGSGKNFIQINHGGLPITGKKNPQLTFKKKLIEFLSSNNEKTIMKIDSNTDLQLRWGDFQPPDEIAPRCRGFDNVYTVGVKNIIPLYKGTGVKLIIRGHQHKRNTVSYIPENTGLWLGLDTNAKYFLAIMPPLFTCTSFPYSCSDTLVPNFLPIRSDKDTEGFAVILMHGTDKDGKHPHAYENWTIFAYESPIPKQLKKISLKSSKTITRRPARLLKSSQLISLISEFKIDIT